MKGSLSIFFALAVGGAAFSSFSPGALAQQGETGYTAKTRRGAQTVALSSTLERPAGTAASDPANRESNLTPVATPAASNPNVAELNFDRFFKMPVGDRGLELTDFLRALDGKTVRVTGYMINHVHANPRVFILSPVPLTFHQCEYGLCDDLPMASVHVKVGGTPHERIPYIPGMLTFTGRLSVGPREELDGRISNVRLLIDPAAITELLHQSNAPKSEPLTGTGTAANQNNAERGPVSTLGRSSSALR